MSRNLVNSLPTILYSCALFVVWLYSWIRSLVALLGGERSEALLASADGVRWFLRSSVASVERMPWAMIIIQLMCSGMLASCGIFPALGRLLRGETSMRMRRALWSAFVAAIIMMLLLLSAAFYPLDIFRSVSGTFSASPMAGGWPLLLFVTLFVPSAVFGIVGGAFRGVDDIVGAVSSRVKFHACSLVALVPAALLLASMEYEGITLALFGRCSFLLEYTVMIFPFVYRLLQNKKQQHF